MKTSEMFYRINEDGNAVILEKSGEACTRIAGATTTYPIGSELSCAYEHPEGIVLTVTDARALGIPNL